MKDLDQSDVERDARRMNDAAAQPDGQLIVIVSWPDDPDRGIEPYGPFSSDQERMAWVHGCSEAAGLGYELLRGAHYQLLKLDTPFDPHHLMQDGSPQFH